MEMKNIKVGDDCYVSGVSDLSAEKDRIIRRKILAILSDGCFVTECLHVENECYVEKWKFAVIAQKTEPYSRETFPKDGAWIKRPKGREYLVLSIGDEGVEISNEYLSWEILAEEALIRAIGTTMWRAAHL